VKFKFAPQGMRVTAAPLAVTRYCKTYCNIVGLALIMGCEGMEKCH